MARKEAAVKVFAIPISMALIIMALLVAPSDQAWRPDVIDKRSCKLAYDVAKECEKVVLSRSTRFHLLEFKGMETKD